MTEKRKILILCTGNSARSQMAEGILNDMGPGQYEVFSAGTKPGLVRPEAVKAMDEIGIDISGHRSKSVDEFFGVEMDVVLTVCDNAKQNCPYFPAKTSLIHHAFEDPAEVEGDEQTRMDAFRSVRDEISKYLENEFVHVLDTK